MTLHPMPRFRRNAPEGVCTHPISEICAATFMPAADVTHGITGQYVHVHRMASSAVISPGASR